MTFPDSSSAIARWLEIWPGKRDRKSTRLNSSHGYISYAVFCLKKKKNTCPNAYSLAISALYTQDALSRSWWLCHVDSQGEKRKVTSQCAVRIYVATTVHEMSAM